MELNDPVEILKAFDFEKGQRSNWESYWENVAQVTFPRKDDIITKRTSGEELGTWKLYDSTAIASNQMLAAGLHGHLTNPATQWFSLKLADNAQLTDQAAKQWIKTAEDVVYDVLNSSNFNQMIHEAYLDLGCFGTSVLFEAEDEKDVVRFYARNIKEIVILENNKGRVDSLFRNFELTAQQAYQSYGESAGAAVMKDYKAGRFSKTHEFVEYIGPRYAREAGKKDQKNKPFKSITVNKKEKSKVAEGGFDEFPYFVVRFTKSNDEKYGYSPAMNALSDIRMLNEMKKDIIIAAAKRTNPPIEIGDETHLLPLDLGPHGINYKIGGNSDAEIRPIETGSDPRISRELLLDTIESVRNKFYADLFLLLTDRPEMTATEVMERTQEKMIMLGPTLGRLMTELLDPIILRTFKICLRRGLIPPPPESLRSNPVVEYESPLAKAQRQGQAQAIVNYLTVIGNIAQIDPTITDNINIDGTAIELANIYGVPPNVVNSMEAVQNIREARQQQQQQLAQQQALMSGGQVAKDFAKAGKDAAAIG